MAMDMELVDSAGDSESLGLVQPRASIKTLIEVDVIVTPDIVED